MSAITSNMGLKKWDQLTDSFSHTELAANFDLIDAHDHTAGNGVQIGPGGLSSGIVGINEIADGAVIPSKLNDASITTTKLANLSVSTGKLVDSAVTTAKIADANVTAVKLASNAVTTAKITDANVTTVKIADLNVTTAKLAASAVTTNKWAPTSGVVSATSDLTLTTSWQDVPGATVTFSTTQSNIVMLVWAAVQIITFTSEADTLTDAAFCRLVVDGSAQTGNALINDRLVLVGPESTAIQVWRVTLASAASHTVKLQGSVGSTSGGGLIYSANTRFMYMLHG